MAYKPNSPADTPALTCPSLAEKAFQSLTATIDATENRYIRSRGLLDGPDRTAAKFVAGQRDRLSSALSENETQPFLHWAISNRSGLRRVTLNAAAWFALMQQAWQAALDLTNEVVARDHHDLLAQRISDAATEQSTSLHLPVDRWLETRTCPAPFRQIETRTNGSVHFCCSAWQPVTIGSLRDKEKDFWNSKRAKAIRKSVLEGDFSHCSRWNCPAIAGRRLPPKEPDKNLPQQDEDPLHVEKGPDRVILSHDRSCNIQCPSCRTKLINLAHRKSERLDKLFEERLLPLVAEASQVKVTGSGDPFGSRHFRFVLKKLTSMGTTGRRIQLHTNGLLADERAWEELDLWDQVSSVWVSVDAASAETYSVVRRGGQFDKLRKNLGFLGMLRRTGSIDSFRLDFVVQQQNFCEIGDFVRLAVKSGADGVYFLRLRNWGHYSADEFRKMDVCSEEHPEHDLLLRHLADPGLRQPGIELGSMTALVDQSRQKYEQLFL